MVSLSEGGIAVRYTVSLNTEPMDEVMVTLASTATGIVRVSPTSLTFTTTNWNTRQTVTVAGVETTSITPAARE